MTSKSRMLLLLPLLVGCSLSSNRTQELVEARLRQQDDVIRELSQRLQDSNASITALQQEADALRLASQQGVPPILPEQADPTFRVQTIAVSTLMSGGIDRDQFPGDDQFTLLITPQDAGGNWIRATGELEIELFDFTRTGNDQRIGHWQMNRNETGALWHQGVVGTGFQFTSAWQQSPSYEFVHVHARLKTPDGRQFDTTSKLRVTPPPASQPQAIFEPPMPVGRASTKVTAPPGWTSTEPRATTVVNDE